MHSSRLMNREIRGCLGEERTAFLDTLPERDLIVRENKP